MSTIALQLRESTRSAHNSAEGHGFQKELGSGSLPLPTYSAYLSQLFLVHQALESAMNGQPYMGPVVSQEQLQTEFLRQDLDALGVNPAEITPVNTTKTMLNRINELAKSSPTALLGYHYVLLGSKHGGKFIASVSKKSYSLGSRGAFYFDPYGPEFQQHWQHFVNGINRLTLPEAEIEHMLFAASEMFAFVESLGSELMTRRHTISGTEGS